jgi:hypothetical protein
MIGFFLFRPGGPHLTWPLRFHGGVFRRIGPVLCL